MCLQLSLEKKKRVRLVMVKAVVVTNAQMKFRASLDTSASPRTAFMTSSPSPISGLRETNSKIKRKRWQNVRMGSVFPPLLTFSVYEKYEKSSMCMRFMWPSHQLICISLVHAMRRRCLRTRQRCGLDQLLQITRIDHGTKVCIVFMFNLMVYFLTVCEWHSTE